MRDWLNLPEARLIHLLEIFKKFNIKNSFKFERNFNKIF